MFFQISETEIIFLNEEVSNFTYIKPEIILNC